MKIRKIPNGGLAILDNDGKMLAYKKQWQGDLPKHKTQFAKFINKIEWDWQKRG